MDPLGVLGSWNLTRTVRDRRTGTVYTAAGTALFTQEVPQRIRWAEEGTLSWEGTRSPFTRMLFIVRGEGESWRVVFEDGRDFHPWGQQDVTHPCRADLYRGGVDAPRDEGWSITWDVTGPAKDYAMHTRYVRH